MMAAVVSPPGLGLANVQRAAPMKRSIFEAEHEAFRDSTRRFMQNEVAPHVDTWREQGCVSREVWRKAGAQSLLCMWADEAYGGAGNADSLIFPRAAC